MCEQFYLSAERMSSTAYFQALYVSLAANAARLKRTPARVP